MLSGKAGSVQIGSNTLSVLRWTLDYEVEVSKFGVGGWKEGVAGVADWKGSFEMVESESMPAPGATVNLSLKEGTTGKTYSGSAIVKKMSVTVNVDTGEAIRYTIDFEGNGQLTIA